MKYGFAVPFAATRGRIDYPLLEAVKKAGFDFVELSGVRVMQLEESELESLLAFLDKIGLRCEGIAAFMPATLNFLTTGRDAFDAYLRQAVERFRRLGVKRVGFGSGPSRAIPDGMSTQDGMGLFAQMLRERFLPLLEEKDMSLLIEPLRKEETNLIHLIPEAAAVVDMIGSERAGVVADTFHMMSGAERPETVAAKYLPYIRHLHVSERDRIMPVHAYTDECAGFVRAFVQNGYDATISFETKCDDLADLSCALVTLKKLVS